LGGDLPLVSPRRHAADLRETWQGRALAATLGRPMGLVLQSVIAEVYDAEVLATLMYCVDDEFEGAITGTFICSRAKVDRYGHVVADVVYGGDPVKSRDVVIFKDELSMRDMFRRLADHLRFSDRDRLEMFACLKRWCPSDMRIDPTMDPMDPDAKRLRVH